MRRLFFLLCYIADRQEIQYGTQEWAVQEPMIFWSKERSGVMSEEDLIRKLGGYHHIAPIHHCFPSLTVGECDNALNVDCPYIEAMRHHILESFAKYSL